jgi:hypothetical protein
LVAVIVLWWASLKAGDFRSLHVEWGYTPPSDPAVTGFNLYQEGVKVVEWTGSDLREADVICDLTASTTKFTLTAAFDDNTESPHSTPFPFSLSNTEPVTVKGFILLSLRAIRLNFDEKMMVAGAVIVQSSNKG